MADEKTTNIAKQFEFDNFRIYPGIPRSLPASKCERTWPHISYDGRALQLMGGTSMTSASADSRMLSAKFRDGVQNNNIHQKVDIFHTQQAPGTRPILIKPSDTPVPGAADSRFRQPSSNEMQLVRRPTVVLQ